MRIASAVLILLALALGAQAETIVTYNVTGTYPDGLPPSSFYTSGATFDFSFTLDFPTSTRFTDPGQFVTADEGEGVPEPGTFPLMIGAALLLAPVLLKLRKNR